MLRLWSIKAITHLFGGQNSIKTGLIPPSQVSFQYQPLFTWLFLETLGISRYILMPEDAEKNNVLVNLLLNPSSVCPPQDRPIIGRRGSSDCNHTFCYVMYYTKEIHLLRQLFSYVNKCRANLSTLCGPLETHVPRYLKIEILFHTVMSKRHVY